MQPDISIVNVLSLESKVTIFCPCKENIETFASGKFSEIFTVKTSLTGIGLSFGSGYTDIFVAPSAIYVLNPTFALGTSLHLGYASQSNYYTSFLYGASIIGLVNPFSQIQLSAELQEINSSINYKVYGENKSNNYWTTGLYLGAGYRTGNVTVGVRYDVLYDANKSIYGDPFMPFVRVYF